MRIGFYNPYFDSLGGGERYILSIAAHLSKSNIAEILWDDPAILQKASQRYSLDFSKVRVKTDFFRNDFFVQKLIKSKLYDIIFFFTDGSIPVTLAGKNVLMFEVPFQNMSIPAWKLHLFSKIVSISEFTRKNLPVNVRNRSEIIYPPVDVDAFHNGKKSKIILTVGRFGTYPSKKHTILIEAFGKLMRKMKGWKLVIAGGLQPSDKPHFDNLKDQTRGLPIELIPNIGFSNLQNLYSASPLYWHAAGYGETNPENMEHFGITPVEAMASGAVPIVFRGGGLPEIIEHGINGLLWETPDQLVRLTTDLLSKPLYLKLLSRNAVTRSRVFHPENFYKAIDELVASVVSQ